VTELFQTHGDDRSRPALPRLVRRARPLRAWAAAPPRRPVARPRDDDRGLRLGSRGDGLL